MNKNQFNKEIKAFKEKRIPDNRKDYMKSEILSHARNNPISTTTEQSLFKKVAVIGLAIAVIFGGTAFAAEQSLPGDILYPVKISVLEPFVKATKMSAETKAQYEAYLETKRVEEQKILAERNKNQNVTTSAEVEQEALISNEESSETTSQNETTANEDSNSASVEIETEAGVNIKAPVTEASSSSVGDLNIEVIETIEDEVGIEIEIDMQESVPLPEPPITDTNSSQISI